jgi:hypothetical protein
MNKAKEIERIILEGTPAERRYLFELSPKHFAYYYFTQYFSYPPAPFHQEMWDDYNDLMSLEIFDLMWEEFRESAKTSLFQIGLIHGIVYNRFSWANWSSYAKENAENALFDIAIELQTNERLIADYGSLYDGGLEKSKEKTKNRLGDFITREIKDRDGEVIIHKTRFTAFSTQQSWRGRKWGKQRPDVGIFDDFENEITIESAAITQKVIENIEAAKAGMSPNGKRIYLCNGISDSGSVAYIKNLIKDDPKGRVRSVAVVDMKGEITWPGKYVFTDLEAVESHKDPQKRKVSLETKKRQLKNYEAEMMNNPTRSEDLFFNRIKVDHAIKTTAREPEEISAGLNVFETYKPNHRYAVGGDPAGGTGRDHSASVIVDFTAKCIPATFMDNRIAPDLFGHELRREALLYGKCIVAPERIGNAVATVIALTDTYDNVYLEHKLAQIGDPVKKQYGWNPTKENVGNALHNFKTAFESGELTIYDERLLQEMRTYSRSDFMATTSIVTNHYDLLRAAIIAYDMLPHATIAEAEEDQWEEDYQANASL